MNPLLLSIALAIVQPPAGSDREPATAGHMTLDGTWSVVAFERSGKPLPTVRGTSAAVRDNTITFAGRTNKVTGGITGTARDTDVGPTSRASESGTTVGPSLPPLRLTFGPMGAVRVEELAAGDPRTVRATRDGVYVASGNYLAITVHDKSGRTVTDAPEPPVAGSGAAEVVTPGTEPVHLTLILRRTNSGQDSTPGDRR